MDYVEQWDIEIVILKRLGTEWICKGIIENVTHGNNGMNNSTMSQ